MQVQLVRDFAIKYRREANKEILCKLVEVVLQKIIIVFFYSDLSRKCTSFQWWSSWMSH